jgi:hypothetical protein
MNSQQTSACTNPWHAGTSLGGAFFPACPSCGGSEQPRSADTLPPRVAITFTSGRSVTRLFPSRAEAERYAADLQTWAYVARLEVLPSSDQGAKQ